MTALTLNSRFPTREAALEFKASSGIFTNQVPVFCGDGWYFAFDIKGCLTVDCFAHAPAIAY